MARAIRKTQSARRGALQSMELLVLLPILGLIGAGLFQFGIFFIEQQRLQSAVDAACRVAAQQHSSDDTRQTKAEAMFFQVLGNVSWSKSCDVDISLRLVADSPAAMVEVKVPSKQVQPDLLGFVGLGLSDDDYMSATALMPCL